MLTGGVRTVRVKEAQEVAGDCQTQEDFRAEMSEKTGWNKQHHHDLSHVQENGDSLSGLEGERRRKEKERKDDIFIELFVYCRHCFMHLPSYYLS